MEADAPLEVEATFIDLVIAIADVSTVRIDDFVLMRVVKGLCFGERLLRATKIISPFGFRCFSVLFRCQINGGKNLRDTISGG